MSDWHLAQVNIGRLRESLDHSQLAAFVDALDPVNAAVDRAPGFVWRLQTEDGNATAVEAFTWDAGDSAGVIINMSVWSDVEHLTAFVLGELHRAILRRRREFFQKMTEAYLACWWVPKEHRPSTDEAEKRVRYLRAHGPTPFAFTLRHHFPPPDDEASDEALRNDDDRSVRLDPRRIRRRNRLMRVKSRPRHPYARPSVDESSHCGGLCWLRAPLEGEGHERRWLDRSHDSAGVGNRERWDQKQPVDGGVVGPTHGGEVRVVQLDRCRLNAGHVECLPLGEDPRREQGFGHEAKGCRGSGPPASQLGGQPGGGLLATRP